MLSGLISLPAPIAAAFMTPSLPVTYAEGTHRVETPLDTLARIKPLFADMGITRVANITHLDRLGIPTWCAIRPICKQVQVSNGKGHHARGRQGFYRIGLTNSRFVIPLVKMFVPDMVHRSLHY
jgi:hypothetical protein